MILVTGGTGFLGSHLLLHLVKNKISPVATYRTKNKINFVRIFFYENDLKGESLFEKIKWRKCDITNYSDVEKSIKGITKIFHCAGLISFLKEDFDDLINVNKLGTQNLVNLSILKKIKKFIFISSISTLDNNQNNNEINEDSNWDTENKHSPYSFSKFNAELEIWRGMEEGLPSIIVNPGVIIGSGITPNPSNYIKKFTKNKLVFYPSGNISFVHINDVVSCIFKLMNSKILNQRFILVSNNWPYEKLFRLILKKSNKKQFMIKADKKILYTFNFFGYLLSKFFFKKRIFNSELIKSVCNLSVINGNRIKSFISFNYKETNDTNYF